MMTGNTLSPILRRAIGDDKVPYRWPDTLLVSYINTAKNVIYGLRPDLASITGIVSSMPAHISGMTDTIPLNELAAAAVIHYVAFMCFEGDAEHVANDQLAKEHYEHFLSEVR